ncbi:major capsid protein [Desulfobulbus sp.]|uniref:major capsid protein n=1 Tax=Desulfobulbus sp. TaxID=895 RepID=UPI00286F0BD8|nr:major capsid protein [Desulfobulbus sp.]
MNAAGVRVINPVLSTVAQGYQQADLVGSALFPRVPVEISGGQILEFGKESFKLYNSRRAPGGPTKRISFGYLGKPFALYNDALEAPVPREFMRDAKVMPGLDLGQRAVNLVMRSLLLGLEVAQAALATDPAQYDANHKITLAGASKWSDPASDPLIQMESYKEAIRSTVGIRPNTLVLSAQAFSAAKTNPKIRDQFKYTSADSITLEMLARAFDIKRLVVGEAITSDDAGTISDVWGNNAILAYVPDAPTSMEVPSYGYTYTMNGHPLVEEPYYDHNAKSWVYGVSFERAPVLSGITSGFLIQAVK